MSKVDKIFADYDSNNINVIEAMDAVEELLIEAKIDIVTSIEKGIYDEHIGNYHKRDLNKVISNLQKTLKGNK